MRSVEGASRILRSSASAGGPERRQAGADVGVLVGRINHDRAATSGRARHVAPKALLRFAKGSSPRGRERRPISS
jgi:hypothetical protein